MTSRKKMPRACHDRATSLHFSIYAIANLYLYSVFINMRLAVVEQGAANPDYAREQKIRSALFTFRDSLFSLSHFLSLFFSL